jgi:hypothetical protein
MFGLSHGRKGHFSQMSESKVTLVFHVPKRLIKTTIPFGQCGHFNQVGPFEKSHFLVVYGDKANIDIQPPFHVVTNNVITKNINTHFEFHTL